jgi:hypothetical protein
MGVAWAGRILGFRMGLQRALCVVGIIFLGFGDEDRRTLRAA